MLREAVGETHAKVFSLKKNKPSHSFLSGPHVFPCCLSPLGENNCIQLTFNVFYGPISMKERCAAPLLGLAKSLYYINYCFSHINSCSLFCVFSSCYEGLIHYDEQSTLMMTD